MRQELQNKTELLNTQFIEHQTAIERIQNLLMSDPAVMEIMLGTKDSINDFIGDKVVLFNFLRYHNFNEDIAVTRLIDTIQWRKEHNISAISHKSVASEFFENGFAFFHGQDMFGRPIAVVRLKRFPQFRDKSKPLAEFIGPYTCLVMEMARKLMRDITCDREHHGEPHILVCQITVIIDIAKAPFIPIDANLVQSLMVIMDKHFPGFVGSVFIMNFGWMYQGLWQMVKFLLSEEARNSISFPALKDILEIIHEDTLLEELGGKNSFCWEFENDTVLQKYGADKELDLPPLLPSSASLPPLSPVPSPTSSSIRSWSVTSDDFFDAGDYFLESVGSFSNYATPGTMTPNSAEPGAFSWPLWPVGPSVDGSTPRNLYYWIGSRMGTAFMTSFLGTRTPQRRIDGFALASRLSLIEDDQFQIDLEFQTEDQFITFDNQDVVEFNTYAPHFPHLLPPENKRSVYAVAPLRATLQKIEQRVVRITRRVFRLSFAYKGAVYWVLLYVFLRGPVEHVLRKALNNFISAPQKVAYTTVGLTAAMAAAIGSSLTASLTNGP